MREAQFAIGDIVKINYESVEKACRTFNIDYRTLKWKFKTPHLYEYSCNLYYPNETKIINWKDLEFRIIKFDTISNSDIRYVGSYLCSGLFNEEYIEFTIREDFIKLSHTQPLIWEE